MILKKYIAFLLSFLGVMYYVHAQPAIDEALKKNFPRHTEIAIALIDADSVRFLGFRKEGKKWDSVDNRNSVFEIGSISKVFTAALLARAVKAGGLNLNDPIAQSVSIPIHGAEKDGKVITYLMLANHTSGLPRLPAGLMRSIMFQNLLAAYLWPFSKKNGNPYLGYDDKKLNKYLRAHIKLKSTPGEVFHYSNLGAGLLGYLLEVRSGQSYEDMLQEQILKPNGMTSSGTQREPVAGRLVRGRNTAGRKVKNWDLEVMAPAGGILSTVDDLSKFLLASMHPDSVLSLQQQPTFRIGTDEEVALGWFINEKDAAHPFYWHNGGTGGYSSAMAFDPQTKRGAVILCNITSKNDLIDELCFQLVTTVR